MKRRQKRERMKRLLARRERHGWSWSELSRRSGLPAWKLRWWHKRFASDEIGRGGRFPQVVVVEPQQQRPPLEVVLASGARIVVPAEFDAGHLKRLLKTLSEPC